MIASCASATVPGIGGDDVVRRTAVQGKLRERPLRIGISSRSLFCLEDEHEVFARDGVRAYEVLQRSRENLPLAAGPGLDVVERLLALNETGVSPYVEVVLLSRNSPDTSLRVFRAIEGRGLAIKVGSFTGGRALAPLVRAWDVDLFLSNEADDVLAAAEGGAAAARLGSVPRKVVDDPPGEVRIALDGDAVVFGAESDLIYRKDGLDAFLRHERENASRPMAAGPFGGFLHKIAALRQATVDDQASKVRIAIVTARSAPAHERVVQTLRAWGTPADEAHFVGGRSKAPILQAFAPHVFFDDQECHVSGAADVVVAALVPGPHRPASPVIQSVR